MYDVCETDPVTSRKTYLFKSQRILLHRGVPNSHNQSLDLLIISALCYLWGTVFRRGLARAGSGVAPPDRSSVSPILIIRAFSLLDALTQEIIRLSIGKFFKISFGLLFLWVLIFKEFDINTLKASTLSLP